MGSGSRKQCKKHLDIGWLNHQMSYLDNFSGNIAKQLVNLTNNSESGNWNTSYFNQIFSSSKSLFGQLSIFLVSLTDKGKYNFWGW